MNVLKSKLRAHIIDAHIIITVELLPIQILQALIIQVLHAHVIMTVAEELLQLLLETVGPTGLSPPYTPSRFRLQHV